MRFQKLYSLLVLLAGLSISSCSQDLLVSHAREENFYTPLINEKRAPKKVVMSEEKIFHSDDYPMRFALYEDNRFYYQVDELGDGWGRWALEDGYMKLYAARAFFEMRFVVSGAEAIGEERIIKFRDRSGIRSYKVSLRDPQRAAQDGVTLPALRRFKKNSDGI